MEKIPTAEELLANNIDGLRDIIDDEDLFIFYKGVIECYAIEFAKIHVQQALKEASEKALMEEDWVWDGEEENHVYTGVDKYSILKSYPLENIN